MRDVQYCEYDSKIPPLYSMQKYIFNLCRSSAKKNFPTKKKLWYGFLPVFVCLFCLIFFFFVVPYLRVYISTCNNRHKDNRSQARQGCMPKKVSHHAKKAKKTIPTGSQEDTHTYVYYCSVSVNLQTKPRLYVNCWPNGPSLGWTRLTDLPTVLWYSNLVTVRSKCKSSK